MKNEMGMKYRKVLPVAYTANSVRNRILRQQFALKYLEIDFSSKVVINCDESWLGMSDYR